MVFFQILMDDYYEQTNSIKLLFFTQYMLRILQQTKELSIIHFKDQDFEFITS